jgi:hypothetical protein
MIFAIEEGGQGGDAAKFANKSNLGYNIFISY